MPFGTTAKIEELLAVIDRSIREIVSTTINAPATGLSLEDLVLLERSNANLTLQQLADRAGLAKTHIWEIEQGKTFNPTVSSCAALAKALGISFEVVCHAALVSYKRAQEEKKDALKR